MKRCLAILLTLAWLLMLCACAVELVDAPPPLQDQPLPEIIPELPSPFPGKIAIITTGLNGSEEEYCFAQQELARYGAAKILHIAWPDDVMAEPELMVKTMAEIAADPGIKALVINQAVSGTLTAIHKLQEIRSDIFITLIEAAENTPQLAQVADLILSTDEVGMGPAMIQQAHKMGAKTFVYYSFPRHTAHPLLAQRYELMEQECVKLGITFVDATVPDPQEKGGIAGSQQAIWEGVAQMAAQYGQDTAFFSTSCALQPPLVLAVVEAGAIYPQPCCPSPYHGIVQGLGIKFPEEYQSLSAEGLTYAIDESARILQEKNMPGRISTWPVPAAMLMTAAGVEYAVKRLNGEAPPEGIDVALLEQCMADYAGVHCFTRVYEENGVEYPNSLLVREDYLTFGEEQIKND